MLLLSLFGSFLFKEKPLSGIFLLERAVSSCCLYFGVWQPPVLFISLTIPVVHSFEKFWLLQLLY